ncbi:MAG TPA: PAS domain S-box protein, partial [Gemmatimonadales bacterium]|nr:PAS domain S-box protein [Gemmatimonadales bacterium]
MPWSLDQYAAFLDALPDPALVVESGERVLLINPPADALFGEAGPGAVPRALQAFFAPTEWDRVSGDLVGHLVGTERWTREVVCRRADGSQLPVQLSGAPLQGTGRGLALVLVHDATGARAARDRVRISEDRLLQAVRASRIGIFDHDHRTDAIYWSAEQRASYGWDLTEEVTLSKFLAQVHPGDVERIAEAVSRAHDPTGPGLFDVEHRIIRRDGRTRWLLTRSQTFFEGEGALAHPVRTVGAVLDVTEERETEQAALLFRQAADLATEAIFWLNRDGGFVYANDTACRSLGYTREELLRLTLWEVDPVYPRAEWDRRWAEFDQRPGQGTIQIETLHRRKDGTLIPVEVLGQRLDLKGSSLHVSYVRDLTERRRLEAQLRQAQRMESVGRLAGGVAHDFNNLLTAIGGSIELALLDLRPSDPVYELLTDVQRAAASATNLTRQLLAFSRKQVIDPRVVNLNAVIEELQKMLRRLVGEDIALQVVLDPALGQVRVDQGQLEQILVNLVLNARDAMPGGGRLTLETANVTLDAEYVRTHPHVEAGDFVMLAVADEGTGIGADAMAHLFEPFFTTKAAGRGTGLGLAVVYGAVKQNHGSIEVYSEPDHGTVFKLY